MSDVTVESLQDELTAVKTALEEASNNQPSTVDQDRLTFLEGEHKKLIGDRDKAKDEKRLAEEKRLTEQGEYKTLAEQKQTEVTDLTAQLESLNGNLEAYQQRDAKELEALLPNVPEALREQVSDDSLPLEKRLSLARALADTKQKPPGYRGPGEPEPETLQAQYEAAMKDGKVSEAMRIKGQMFKKE